MILNEKQHARDATARNELWRRFCSSFFSTQFGRRFTDEVSCKLSVNDLRHTKLCCWRNVKMSWRHCDTQHKVMHLSPPSFCQLTVTGSLSRGNEMHFVIVAFKKWWLENFDSIWSIFNGFSYVEELLNLFRWLSAVQKFNFFKKKSILAVCDVTLFYFRVFFKFPDRDQMAL